MAISSALFGATAAHAKGDRGSVGLERPAAAAALPGAGSGVSVAVPVSAGLPVVSVAAPAPNCEPAPFLAPSRIVVVEPTPRCRLPRVAWTGDAGRWMRGRHAREARRETPDPRGRPSRG